MVVEAIATEKLSAHGSGGDGPPASGI